MNGATVSILLRLKHAVMFEDFQTRHTCASALCKIALRLPDPVRFDAYCFLRGLVDAAAIFPLTAPLGGASATAENEPGRGCGGGGGGGEHLLTSYRREQEAVLERVETAGAYGIGEAVAPVLDYLTCFYASLDDEKSRDEARSSLGSSSPGQATESGDGLRSEKQENFLNLYKGLLDSQGAAPGA
ncbi:unnamed protein product [Laminaria digitata]